MTKLSVQKLREAAIGVPDADLDGGFVDHAFDEVAGLIRRRFGLTRDDADALLADIKADAVIAFDEIANDDLVHLDDAIDTIADYFSDAS